VTREIRRAPGRTTGFAEVEDTSAEILIAEDLADALDVSFSAVRPLNPWALPGRDLSNDSILHVVDGVDVPKRMTFAYTEAEFLLERVSTVSQPAEGRLRRRLPRRGCAQSPGSRALLTPSFQSQ
jgi:hypothetical protein